MPHDAGGGADTPYTDAEISIVYEMWQAGEDSAAIGERLGRTPRAITRKVSAMRRAGHGLAVRGHGFNLQRRVEAAHARQEELAPKILEMWKAGSTAYAIGRACHVGMGVVRRALIAAGQNVEHTYRRLGPAITAEHHARAGEAMRRRAELRTDEEREAVIAKTFGGRPATGWKKRTYPWETAHVD